MRLPTLLLGLATGLVLGACASAPAPPAAIGSLFDDDAFAPPSVRIDPAEALALSAPMKRYLDEQIAPRLHRGSLNNSLIDALYTRGQLQLAYDAERTRSAAEAFDARAGNCLSLVLMTAAFARELGVAVRFQEAVGHETWARDGNLVMVAGHVNLALGVRPGAWRLNEPGADWVTVDFLPNVDLQRQRVWPIDEARVVAMYMNNRSAEALAGGRVDDAYWWARAAVERDPRFHSAHNTLGVVYLRRGLTGRAEAALRSALALDADNPQVLGNLVQVLQRLGRDDEAQRIAQRLERLQPTTPFAHLERGQQAMLAGEHRLARQHFEQALRLGGDYHEFHFALAQALAMLGDHAGARRELERALEASATQRLQAIYAGKLERLREQRRN